MMNNFLNKYALNNLKRNKNTLKFSNFYFSIFIKTQATPNPHFLKFLPGKEILKDGETYDFSDIKQATISPLARKIFDVKFKIIFKIQISGITRVFYGRDYISVGKQELVDWSELKPQIIEIVCDHFAKDTELFEETPEPEVFKKDEIKLIL